MLNLPMLLLFDVTEYCSRPRLSNKSFEVSFDFDAMPNISMSGASLLPNMLSSSNRPPLFESTLVVLSLDDAAARKSVLFCDLEPELAAEKSSSPESESSKSSEIFNFGARFESDLLSNGSGPKRSSFSNTSSCSNDELSCCSCRDCCCCWLLLLLLALAGLTERVCAVKRLSLVTRSR